MLKNYEIILQSQNKNKMISSYAYYLYAALLEECSDEFAERLHENEFTPISQFVKVINKKIIWNITLFSYAIEEIDQIINKKKQWYIKKEDVIVRVVEIHQSEQIEVETLFAMARKYSHQGNKRKLDFETATAFKSGGKYQNLPNMKFIVQSLVQKWNGAFPTCPIDDEDGEGVETIISGLYISEYKLRTKDYRLKRQNIRGFQGYIVVENELSEFHKELAEVLLIFAQYSGIGIKTALGMGGVSINLDKENFYNV